MKHFGVMLAFGLATESIISIAKLPIDVMAVAVLFCMPLFSIFSSVICKYMGWNK